MDQEQHASLYSQHQTANRRYFISATVTGLPLLHTACASLGQSNRAQTHLERNGVLELTFQSSERYDDPYNEVDLNIEFGEFNTQPKIHPAFYAGGNTWKARITASEVGSYSYRTVCSNYNDKGLHLQSGTFHVSTGTSRNPLYRSGRLRVAADKRHFVYSDGKPFFWTGDTWWMGLCDRLKFPDDFDVLTQDRVKKGFNVIQIVAGPYPDMDSFDPRGRNEAGFPLTENFETINPNYFEYADRRIIHLIENGLMPCIVGMWGYYAIKMGEDKVKRYWRYLIARYGAYPVVWCLAGEGSMPYYLSNTADQDRDTQEAVWTHIAQYVHQTDAFNNLVTIHPSRFGRDVVKDPSVLDFEMLQTGHSDLDSVPNTAKTAREAYHREPIMPVINAETNYEGILGRSWQNIQRLSFYSSALNGMAGFTYGANGIWQLNLPGKPYGKSPHGRSWGDTPWQDAYQLPGSKQIGIGSRFMQQFEWWKLESHPEWVDPPYDPNNAYSNLAAGITGILRIIYMPMVWNPAKIVKIESGVHYKAAWFDPIHGEFMDIGNAEPDANGEWTPPHPGTVHDWILVMKA